MEFLKAAILEERKEKFRTIEEIIRAIQSILGFGYSGEVLKNKKDDSGFKDLIERQKKLEKERGVMYE